ncbi:MAG: hypothetical protein DHS20C02_07900 [Micavibrio sp.]|nr:MAG: hypothetical protein DHS20C02_07900 [Micavibrio sp.]
MRKILMLTALAVVLGVPAAFAEEGSDKAHKRGHHKGKMFEKADTDGNGSISKAEFSDFHNKIFDKMDVDGDGQITREEQKKRREEWKEKRGDRREKRQERREDHSEDSSGE